MDQLRTDLHKILTDKGCSIWGRPFAIDQFDDRDKCVDWLIQSIFEPLARERSERLHPAAQTWAFNGEAPTSPSNGSDGSDGPSVGRPAGKPAEGRTEGGLEP